MVDESPEQTYKKEAEQFIEDKMRKAFNEKQRERTEFEGPAKVGQSL